MMFKVLQRQEQYEGCPIVIRQTGESFEFITCINNEIYSSYVVAKKSLLQKVFFRNYSRKQLRDITSYVYAMATTTIESVLHAKDESPKSQT